MAEYVHRCDFCGWSRRARSAAMTSPRCEACGCGLTSVRAEREVTDPTQDGVVIEQRPSSGSQVDKGSQVTIVVGVLKQDDTLAPAPTEP